jgi:hypothetical protein
MKTRQKKKARVEEDMSQTPPTIKPAVSAPTFLRKTQFDHTFSNVDSLFVGGTCALSPTFLAGPGDQLWQMMLQKSSADQLGLYLAPVRPMVTQHSLVSVDFTMHNLSMDQVPFASTYIFKKKTVDDNDFTHYGFPSFFPKSKFLEWRKSGKLQPDGNTITCRVVMTVTDEKPIESDHAMTQHQSDMLSLLQSGMNSDVVIVCKKDHRIAAHQSILMCRYCLENYALFGNEGKSDTRNRNDSVFKRRRLCFY